MTATWPGAPDVADGVRRLGAFAAGLRWGDVPEVVRTATRRVLQDSLAVMVAGGRLAESRRLQEVLPAADGGSATVAGAARRYPVTDAAWLNGTALVALELDEGNKRIRGHATAHVLPAVLAVAEHRRAPGAELGAALVAGHEVASRFGAATLLDAGVHPHGNWGVAGPAAGVARLLGAPADVTARAIDAAGALAMATPFAVATAGLGVRNGWIGAANVSGIHAAVVAGDDPVVGVAGESLGRLLGRFDPEALVAGLGRDFAMTGGYFKRHASCGYTHPAADLALDLFAERGPVDPAGLAAVEVSTHRLGAGLDGTAWPTRLAAMFSIPFVVATALLHGDCSPARFDDDHRADPGARILAERIRVVEDPALTDRLPAHRAARLDVRWADGGRWTGEVENPVGDADYRPLSDDDLFDKAAALLGGAGQATAVWDCAVEILGGTDVAVPMARLRALAASPALAGASGASGASGA